MIPLPRYIEPAMRPCAPATRSALSHGTDQEEPRSSQPKCRYFIKPRACKVLARLKNKFFALRITKYRQNLNKKVISNKNHGDELCKISSKPLRTLQAPSDLAGHHQDKSHHCF